MKASKSPRLLPHPTWAPRTRSTASGQTPRRAGWYLFRLPPAIARWSCCRGGVGIKKAPFEVFQCMRVAKKMAPWANVPHRRKRLIKIVPTRAFGHAIAHCALFGVHHKLGDARCALPLRSSLQNARCSAPRKAKSPSRWWRFRIRPAHRIFLSRLPYWWCATERHRNGAICPIMKFISEISGVPAIGAPDFIETVARK